MESPGAGGAALLQEAQAVRRGTVPAVSGRLWAGQVHHRGHPHGHPVHTWYAGAGVPGPGHPDGSIRPGSGCGREDADEKEEDRNIIKQTMPAQACT